MLPNLSRRPAPVALAVLGCSILGLPALAGAQCGPDQEQTSYELVAIVGEYSGSSTAWAQTVKVGVSGTLDEVDLYGEVSTFTVGTGPLELFIYPTTGGVPDESGTPLVSESIPFSSLPQPGLPAEFSVDLSAYGLAVQAGETLAIVLEVPSGSFDWTFHQSGPFQADAYRRGELLQRPEPSGTWSAYSRSDGYFRTIVCTATGVDDGIVDSDWGLVKARYAR